MHTTIKTHSMLSAAVVAASFLAFGCAAMGGRVYAGGSVQSYSTIVSYGELNLDSEQGARVLYARIRNAAENVCSSLEGRDLSEKKLWQSCFDNAVANAVVQVDKSRVTALHNQTVTHTTKG